MHQHIVQRLTERIGQRYIIILRRCIQPPAHHLLQQPCVGMSVGQRIVQQRQSFVRELEQHGNLVFSPFQFNHGFMLLLRRLQ